MKKTIGFTAGVYDLFHIGHLNLLKRAREKCDYLIVGVSTDEVVEKNKNKTPIIPFRERIAIIDSIKYVDKTIPQTDYSIEGKIKTAIDNHVDIMFVGSDWENTPKWKEIEERLKTIGCKVVYLPHTDGISSSLLREKLK